jgi:uncharacterized membrane protein (DUF485 family)
MGDHLELLNDPEFRAMVRAKDRISLMLTAITIVIYFGFIFLLAFNQKLGDVIGRKISENITLGMPLGVGVIVSSFVLTGIYVRWANGRYDAMIRAIREKVKARGAA